MRRSTQILAKLATLCAVGIVIGLVIQCLLPSPARDVTFSGDFADERPNCQAAVVLSNGVAWTVCTWLYKDKALVELDPESARATPIHAWNDDDGNSPRLAIVRPCDGGELFVVAETRQIMSVVRHGSNVQASVVPVEGDSLLGAECRDGAVELFTAAPHGWSVVRAKDGSTEPVARVSRAQIPGEVAAAWFEQGRWQVIGVRTDGHVFWGPVGGTAKELASPKLDAPPCVFGEPGGWICPNRHRTFALTRAGGAFRATPLQSYVDTLVIQHDGWQMGFTSNLPSRTEFSGLGARDFELVEHDSVLEARRGGTSSVVGQARGLELGAVALPIAGDRIAIWGALGSELVVLDANLQRTDRLNPIARVLRPIERFGASSMSVFDRIGYAVLLAAAPIWLAALALLVRSGERHERWIRRMSATLLAFSVIFGLSFARVLAWM